MIDAHLRDIQSSMVCAIDIAHGLGIASNTWQTARVQLAHDEEDKHGCNAVVACQGKG
jgi:hypothetical protein